MTPDERSRTIAYLDLQGQSVDERHEGCRSVLRCPVDVEPANGHSVFDGSSHQSSPLRGHARRLFTQIVVTRSCPPVLDPEQPTLTPTVVIDRDAQPDELLDALPGVEFTLDG